MTPLDRFRSLITKATESELKNDPTLGGTLIMDRAGRLTVSYAPFEHIQRTARVVIVGITPGAVQASNALIAAREGILAGRSHANVFAQAKTFASFSGPMRTNLVAMLDQIGLAQRLDAVMAPARASGSGRWLSPV